MKASSNGVALTVVLFTAAPCLAAQSAFSLEAGIVTAFEDALFQIGIRSTSAKVEALGVDFAIATFPEGFAQGILILSPDLAFTTAIAITPTSWLFPRLGVSALIGLGDGGAGAVPGVNLGVGYLGTMSSRMGARMDFTYRRYLTGFESAGFSSISIGLAWVH